MLIKSYPDLTGAAPADCAYYAIDSDTYDGAEDSHTRNHVGWGATPDEAIADLRRLLDEIADAEDPKQAAYETARAAEGQPWIAHYLQSIGAKPDDDEDDEDE